MLVEHTGGQTDRGEDQADLAAREHPEPDQELVAGAAHRAQWRDHLADHCSDEEEPGVT